ncbi:MAG: hypothetical protein HY069_00725 [Chlamydiia bacterium]|nr:hypothetical protein [Chlamydiia bacterium]
MHVEVPLFSLIVLVQESRHLLIATLDSLRCQAERRFEVLLMDGIGQGKVEEIARPYSDLALRVQPVPAGQSISATMNQAIALAQGKYLQFLAPGDRYLSQEGLSYLGKLLQAESSPPIVYSGFWMRGSEAVLVPLEKATLLKGAFPKDSWFSKQALLDLGGFDPSLKYRSAFDVLCRFFLKEGSHALCSRRILTDSQYKGLSPTGMVGYALETYRILYRHFGLWPAIRWVFIQDHLQMLHWLGRRFKQAFWKN